MWMDAAAGNEPAEIVFCTVTMTVRYFSTRTYNNAPSPRWPYTWDADAQVLNIPTFRYRLLRAEEWAHDISAGWEGNFYFRCFPPYARILILPIMSINYSTGGPNLGRLAPPPAPPGHPPAPGLTRMRSPLGLSHPRSEPYNGQRPTLLGRGVDGDRLAETVGVNGNGTDGEVDDGYL